MTTESKASSTITPYSNAITTLTSYQAAYKNDFEVQDISVSRHDLAEHAPLHAVSVKFAGAKLTLERHDITKLFSFSKYQRTDDVTITWRESKDFLVRRYHQDWLSLFYDETKDRYVSLDNKTPEAYGLARSFRILLPGGYHITLSGLFPISIPELDLNWSDNAIIQYTMTYKVTSWAWGEK